MRRVGATVKKLRIEDNMFIVLKEGSQIAAKENVDRFISELEKTGHRNIIVTVVSNLDDLITLHEKEMNDLGWYRDEKRSARPNNNA